MIYRVEKILDGYSICFRQWGAQSHCRFLHGYALSFKLHFTAEVLNDCGWVWDFGWLNNQAITIDDMPAKQWFKHMFDHTVIVSHDDPELALFQSLADKQIIQLRIIPYQSCETIAKFVFDKLSDCLKTINNHNATLVRVDVFEYEKNSASFCIE